MHLILSKYYESLKMIVKSARCRLRRSIITGRLATRDLSSHSAVVVAPHPDDEIFGTGGMIAMKREAGVPVHVIFLTEGGSSHATCCSVPYEDVGEVRRKQAVEATDCVGLQSNDLTWFNLRDGKIPSDGQDGFNKAVTNLADEFGGLVPTEIYCPHPHDWFPDHEVTSRIVQLAAQHSRYSFKIIYYTVWIWYNAPSKMSKFFDLNRGWILDIHPVFEKKASAIHRYLNSAPAPCGHPYCGKLPKALLHGIRKANEIFFDGDVDNE
ncbi:hypothetical protein C6A37_06280 [Desulfobacteraceae bacterium SEEP-SAG9]|nr:hypothetical protein C6A37_06280 [Desulfobacteraceae bacterium SEEP-SAG9]